LELDLANKKTWKWILPAEKLGTGSSQ
jgi:hypothetical protein